MGNIIDEAGFRMDCEVCGASTETDQVWLDSLGFDPFLCGQCENAEDTPDAVIFIEGADGDHDSWGSRAEFGEFLVGLAESHGLDDVASDLHWGAWPVFESRHFQADLADDDQLKEAIYDEAYEMFDMWAITDQAIRSYAAFKYGTDATVMIGDSAHSARLANEEN